MIEKVESAPHYRTLHSVFSYHRRQGSFARLHNPTEEKDKNERQSVLDYLNHYEMVSIGICEKILDAEFYRDWMLSPFVRDWNAAADFVQRERWKWDKWTYHARQLFLVVQVTRHSPKPMAKATIAPPKFETETASGIPHLLFARQNNYNF